MKRYSVLVPMILLGIILSGLSESCGATLKVGAAVCDLTPPEPVALDGQMHTRISTSAATPILANVIAFEGENDKGVKSACIMVSLDLVGIRPELESAIRAEVVKAIPGFDPHQLILSATHTHTAPVADVNKYYIAPNVKCMRPNEFCQFAGRKLAPVLAAAWKERQEVRYSYGLADAYVAQSRRPVYIGGKAIMYGKTSRPDFRRLEATEDHDVNSMFFWNTKDKLVAMIVNVSCPSQVVEGLSVLHADYWHFVRQQLYKRYGKDIPVVSLCGAAGDMCPRPIFRHSADARMNQLRGLSLAEAVGQRVANAVEGTFDTVQLDKTANIPFVHQYDIIKLPQYRITESEYKRTKAEADSLREVIKKDPNQHRLYYWANVIVQRYEAQQKDPNASFDVPIHILRIGNTAFCTNPFELFTSYGTQMKARSKAMQTFVVQLTDGCGICGTSSSAGYLPTAEAYKGGGYSAIVKSITVGPDGGQKLVEDSLQRINAMFK